MSVNLYMLKGYFIGEIRFLHWLRTLRNMELLKLKFFCFVEVEALLDLWGNNKSRKQLVSSLGKHNASWSNFVREKIKVLEVSCL